MQFLFCLILYIITYHYNDLNNMTANFQDGCNTLVSKCTACGSTPANNSPTAISASIQSIYTNRYNAGTQAGYTSGYNAGTAEYTSPTKPSTYDTYKNKSMLSQSEFIDFISNGGAKYAIRKADTAVWINKDIQFNNSQISNSTYNIYQIADFNHDDTTNTVDLIAKYTIAKSAFDSSDNDYINSDIRTWLNGTYYNGFDSTLRNKMVNMTVKTDRNGSSATAGSGTLQTTSDKVKLLAYAELGITVSTSDPNKEEGNRYPIFNASTTIDATTDRVRTGAYSYWWFRSRKVDSTNYVWCVKPDGSVNIANYNYSAYTILPVLRVSVS